MTINVLERRFDPAIDKAWVVEMFLQAGGCLDLHRVEWQGSLLARDGKRMICTMTSPDLESTRIALREAESVTGDLWNGVVVDGPGIGEADILTANVIVERRFEEPVSLQEIQDIEDAGAGCLQVRNVRFIRTYFSADRRRMICLYAAPDAESVRDAQREAGVPFTDVWTFRRIDASDVPA